jgi:hypothetical protein
MDKKIAYCGLICNECPAFIATREGDIDKKRELAREWSNNSYQLSAGDINCHGCIGEEKQTFRFCRECPIRQCAIKKKVANCAYCTEYPCDVVRKPFIMSPENKELLDGLRKNLQN